MKAGIEGEIRATHRSKEKWKYEWWEYWLSINVFPDQLAYKVEAFLMFVDPCADLILFQIHWIWYCSALYQLITSNDTSHALFPLEGWLVGLTHQLSMFSPLLEEGNRLLMVFLWLESKPILKFFLKDSLQSLIYLVLNPFRITMLSGIQLICKSTAFPEKKSFEFFLQSIVSFFYAYPVQE